MKMDAGWCVVVLVAPVAMVAKVRETATKWLFARARSVYTRPLVEHLRSVGGAVRDLVETY